MEIATTEELVSAAQFEQQPPAGRSELIDGEIRAMSPTGFEHGLITLKIGRILGDFVEEHRLGAVCGAETGFVLRRDPDTVRAPDVAFVTAVRAAAQASLASFFDGPPDLAVEVVSPSDRDEEVEEKVLDFLAAGTREVWVVRPRTRTVTVYRSLREVFVLTVEDTLGGSELLPGFETPVRALFPQP